MLYKVETEYGSIGITKNVIGKIVVEAIGKYKGRVQISNHKGKLPGLAARIGGSDDISNLVIYRDEKGIDVRVFVVINFGSSIAKVTGQLIEEIHQNVKELTGIELNSVAVIVTGMISKNIVRRHIEVKR